MLSLLFQLFEYLFRGLVLCIFLALGYLYLTRKAEEQVNDRRTQSGDRTQAEEEDFEIMEFTEEISKEYQATIENGGLNALHRKMEANLNKWKNIVIKFAIIGESGAGKSSFINAILGLSAEDKDSAKVGCTETTMECKEYKHPMKKTMSFWDLPGVGTPNFPKENYLDAVEFNKYDFFILITHGRFRENDLWLVKEIEKRGKIFYFVRTKIDFDVNNNRRIHPGSHNTEKLLKQIREHTEKILKDEGVKNREIYLIDNHNQESYEFNSLVKRLIKDIPALKKQSFVLSISAISNDVIKEKVKQLRSTLKYRAVLASLGSLVPVPGVGFACEVGVMIEAVTHFKKQLNTDRESMTRLAVKMNMELDEVYKKMDMSTHVVYASASKQLILSLCSELVTSEAAEAVIKIAIPFLGSFISAAASIPVCAYTLNKLLNICEQEAYRVHKEFQKWMIDTTSTSV